VIQIRVPRNLAPDAATKLGELTQNDPEDLRKELFR
jgi:hypothetical protein